MNFNFFKETYNEYTELCNQHGWTISWDGYLAYIGGIREARKKWVA